MICKKCGRELKDTARFCKYCGIKIDSSDELVNRNSSQKEFTSRSTALKKKKSLRKNIIMITAILVVVILVVITAEALTIYFRNSDIYKGKVNINELLSEYGLTRIYVVSEANPFYDDDIEMASSIRIASKIKQEASEEGFFPGYSYIPLAYTSLDEIPIGYAFDGSMDQEREVIEDLRKLYLKTNNYRLKKELIYAINWLEYDISGRRLVNINDSSHRDDCAIAYTDDGHILSILYYGMDGEVKYLFDYDNNGNVTGLSEQIDGENRIHFQYTYDDKIISIIKTDFLSQVKETNTWDADHYTRVVHYERDDGGTGELRYEYDSYGTLVFFSNSSPDQVYYKEYKCEYDENGNLIKWQENTSDDTFCEFEYDNNGNPTCITEYDSGKILTQIKNEYEVGTNTLLKCNRLDYNVASYQNNGYIEDKLSMEYYPNGTIKHIEYMSDILAGNIGVVNAEEGAQISDRRVQEFYYEYDSYGFKLSEKQYYNGESDRNIEYQYASGVMDAGTFTPSSQQDTAIMPNSPTSSDVLDNNCELNAYPDVNAIVTSYLTAMSEGDTETMASLSSSLSDDMKAFYEAQANYEGNYSNINVYTKKGPRENSFFVLATYDLLINGQTTPLPALMSLYVCRTDSGELYINTEDLSGEEKDSIMELVAEKDYADIINQVDLNYKAVLESDPTLSNAVNVLKDEVEQDKQKILYAN